MRFPSQSIDTIINSFKRYGLGDIEYNKERTIAVFILCICFIDQLSSFRYRIKGDAKRWEQFITDYMNIYEGLNIYIEFRNTLIHNYSSCGKFSLTNDHTFKKPFDKIGNNTIINTNIFIYNLKLAFDKFEKDIRIDKSEANYNVIRWSEKHPVLTSTPI